MLKRTTFVFFFTVYNLFTLLNVVTAKERLIYWTDTQDKKIYCGDADGGQYEKVLSSRDVTLLTAAQGYIYYYEENAIRRENMETRKVETLISETSRASSMVIDTLHSTMYWSADSGKIWRADITGSNKQEFICGLTRPNNLALDLVYENLYWMNDTRDTLFCTGLDGEKIKSVIEHTEKIIDYVVDGRDRRIYFLDDNGRVLKSVNLDGNEEEIVYVFDNINPQMEIQLDHNNQKIYLTDWCGIWSMNTDGTEFIELVSGFIYGVQNLSLDLSKGEMYWFYLYWSMTIYRSHLDGRNVEPLIVNYEYPVCIALDPEREKIYWANSYANIYKCNTDGSNVEFLTNEIYPNASLNDIALDVVNEKMYWARQSEGITVGFANLDGSRVEYPYYIHGFAYGVAVDPFDGTLYWSNSLNTVLGANLNNDSNDVEKIIKSTGQPDDIALDLKNKKIYWTERAIDYRGIKRANLDGSDIQNVITSLEWPSGIALDVDGGKVYWIEDQAGKIKRANLDGTDIEELYTGLSSPYRLALSFENNGSTGVEKKDDGPNLIPQEFALYQNYPNPFNPETTITFRAAKDDHYSLKVYNISGQKVAVLLDDDCQAGTHQVLFDASNLPSGTYFYRLKGGGMNEIKKMILLK